MLCSFAILSCLMQQEELFFVIGLSSPSSFFFWSFRSDMSNQCIMKTSPGERNNENFRRDTQNVRSSSFSKNLPRDQNRIALSKKWVLVMRGKQEVVYFILFCFPFLPVRTPRDLLSGI